MLVTYTLIPNLMLYACARASIIHVWETCHPTPNLYIIVSLIIQFEISLVIYQESSVFFLMKLAWKNGRHSTNIHI